MAYAPNTKDKVEQQEVQQDDGPSAPAMTSSAPGSGPGSSAGKSTAPQANPAQPFQNLQSYLSANAPQVNQQATKIAGDLSNQYGQVTGQVNQAQQDFGNQVKGGYVQNDSNLTNQAIADPTSFVSNPDNIRAFQALYNDMYRGPQNFESTTPYGELSQNVTKAASSAGNFKTLPGMQTYFQSQNPNSTRGGNTLDAVLLQGNRDAYGKVQDAAKPFSTLSDYLSNATSTANAGVTAAQKEASDISSGLKNKFVGEQGIIPTFQSDLNNRLASTKAGAQSNAEKLMQDFLAGGSATPNPTLTEDEYKALGVSPAELQAITESQYALRHDYNAPVDLRGTLTQQSPDVVFNNANAIATPEEYQKAAALSQLTGEDLTNFLDPTLAGNAGKNNQSLVNFNKEGARQTTTEALRKEDLNFINSLPNNSGKPILELLQDAAKNPGSEVIWNPPGAVGGAIPPKYGQYDRLERMKSALPPQQQAIFDNVMKRLGIVRGNVPTQPVETNPNAPIQKGNGTQYVDPATGQTRTAF